MTVCTTTTLRAPLRETLLFVHYYLSAGVDRMYLFFDDPNDEAIAKLEGYDKVTAIRCDAAYWKERTDKTTLTIEERQLMNALEGLSRAREAGYAWILHVDCDELVHTEKPLSAVLDATPDGISVLRFPTAEAVPTQVEYDNVFEETTLFKLGPSLPAHGFVVAKAEHLRLAAAWASYWSRATLARRLGCGRLFRPNYFRAHMMGKSAVRTRSKVRQVGIHFPVPLEPLGLAISHEGLCLHYDSLGFTSWKTKWLRRHDGTATATGLGKPREDLLDRFMELHAAGNELHLLQYFKQLYFMADHQRIILSGLGLLQTLHLDPRRFDPPGNSRV